MYVYVLCISRPTNLSTQVNIDTKNELTKTRNFGVNNPNKRDK